VTAPALEPHTLVLLRRPPDAPDLPRKELDALQEQHLVFLQQMRDRGALLAAGPFRDQADPSLRGLCLYAVGLDEARALAAADPSVRRGRMAADAFVWLVRPGELR
jgi:uncharacterized protein YciI